MKQLFLLSVLGCFFTQVNAQKSLEFSVQTGANMGFVSSGSGYSVENDYDALPALHFGITSKWQLEKLWLETGLIIEGTVFKQEIQYVDANAQSIGLERGYDVAAYLAVPLIAYPDFLPLGLHGGLKPKFEAGSTSVLEDKIVGAPDQDSNDQRIHYLAPFGVDLVVGVSVPINIVTLAFRYERGLLNRLADSPKFKEYDNQFKLVISVRLFQKIFE